MDETLWVARKCHTEMLRLAHQHYPFETGGMLLGYQADDGQTVVRAIIGPGPKARRGRFRFRPDAEYQQEKLEAHFRRTNGQETYLGDWHTHPRGLAALSRLDKRTLAHIAKTPSSLTTRPVMMVLAGGRREWKTIGARFVTSRDRLFFVSYQVIYLEPRLFN